MLQEWLSKSVKAQTPGDHARFCILYIHIICVWKYLRKETTWLPTSFYLKGLQNGLQSIKIWPSNPGIHQFKHQKLCSNPSSVSTFISSYWKKSFTAKWSFSLSTITYNYIKYVERHNLLWSINNDAFFSAFTAMIRFLCKSTASFACLGLRSVYANMIT